MIRLLMASTAIAAILATSSLAQDASSSAPMDVSSSSSSMQSSAMDSASSPSSSIASDAMSSDMSSMSSMSSQPADNTTTTAAPAQRQQVQILSGYTRADSDNLASKIIGRPVYDGPGTDANKLGSVTDLVVNQNGEVSAVILGVGGFLGIGEKQVAVDFSALKWVVAADNTERYVLQTTKDELTNAPDFVTVDDQPGDNNNNNANGNGDNANGNSSASDNSSLVSASDAVEDAPSSSSSAAQ